MKGLPSSLNRASRVLQGTAVVASLSVLGAAHCGGSVSGEIESFRGAFSRVDLSGRGETEETRRAAARAMDGVIAALLNSGRSYDEVRRVLESLPGAAWSFGSRGSEAPSTAQWPRYGSAYKLFSVGSGLTTIWIASYAFGQWDEDGYVSVFAESSGRWRRTDGLDAEAPLHAYPASNGSVPAVALIEHFEGGDGWSGDVQLWLVRHGRLTKRGPVFHTMFYSVERGPESLRISFSDYPGCLSVPVSMVHLNGLELVVRSVDGLPEIQRRTAAPWVAVVDEACASVRDGRQPVANRDVEAAVRKVLNHGVQMWDAGGDAARGEGFVIVSSDAERFFRLDVRRLDTGDWRIQRVGATPKR